MTNDISTILVAIIGGIAVVFAAFLAARTSIKNYSKEHSLSKKRDVVLDITSELADLRSYIIEKAITKPTHNSQDVESQIRAEMLQLTKQLVRAIDKFFVISSDDNCARLEVLHLVLIQHMSEGIRFHFEPDLSFKDILDTEFLSKLNSLRANIIEVLNNELNSEGKFNPLTKYKAAIENTNVSATKMFKSQKHV